MSREAAHSSGDTAPGLLPNLIFNVVLPFLVLNNLGGEKPWRPLGDLIAIPALGPVPALLVSCAFPLGYGLWDLYRRRKWNVISGIGLAGVLLTGGLGLLKLDPFWFAIKEAAIPLLIGAVVVGSVFTRKPLVEALLLNPDLIDTDQLRAELDRRSAAASFRLLLRQATWRLGLLFVASAALNFGIARLIVKSPPQTEAFTQELARLNLWSLAGITVPMMAGFLWAMLALFKGIHRLTGLSSEDLFKSKR